MSRFATLVVVLLLATGCGTPPCLDDDGVVPGVGASMDGASLCVGDSAELLRGRLGDEAATADLGPTVGLRLTWAEPDVVGTLIADSASALQLGAGFVGETAGGVGVGASEEAVRAEFGDPAVEPFTGSWVYAGDGIGFQWADGAVARIHLLAAD